MIPNFLAGMRVVELEAHVGSPFARLSLAELGADVVRVEEQGGAAGTRQHPGAGAGKCATNRAVALDLRTAQGLRRLQDLIVETGTVLAGPPATAALDYERLRAHRPDLIMLVFRGTRRGAPAAGNTVRVGDGRSAITAAGRPDGPVDQLLPVWSAICAMTAATGLLAAERRRRASGTGALVELTLEDVALWTLANLGWLSEADGDRQAAPTAADARYGAFSGDFATADRRRVMVAALTARQWRSLVAATDLEDAFAHLERTMATDFDDDVARGRCGEIIATVLEPWFEQHDFEHVRRVFDAHRVLWGPYQSLQELLRAEAPRAEAGASAAGCTPPAPAPAPPPGKPFRPEDTAAVLRALAHGMANR